MFPAISWLSEQTTGKTVYGKDPRRRIFYSRQKGKSESNPKKHGILIYY